MSVDNGTITEYQKLLQGNTKVNRKNHGKKQPCNKNKRVRHLSEPHIDHYKLKGKTYYRYRHGISPPIHLGSADFILSAVLEKRANMHPVKTGHVNEAKQA